MTGVIKAAQRGNGFSVEPLVPRFCAQEMTVERAIVAKPADPVLAENEELRARLDRQEEAILIHEKALAEAYAEGEAAGRVLAEAEFNEDRQAALDLLEQGLNDARAEFAGALASAEGLAALIAREALNKMFGDCGSRQQIVLDLIKHQFAQIERGGVVRVEVSRDDFPDTSEVARLAAQLGLRADALRVSDELSRGDCRVKLRLGSMDIGLSRQWEKISEALSEMAGTDVLDTEEGAD